MNEKWPTYLFEYNYEGAVYTFEIPAQSEQDAKARVSEMQQSRYLGVLQMKIPVELGIFAKVLCWWKNRGKM